MFSSQAQEIVDLLENTLNADYKHSYEDGIWTVPAYDGTEFEFDAKAMTLNGVSVQTVKDVENLVYA